MQPSSPSRAHRVLAVIQGATYGGAHNQVVRLRDRLAQQGFETRVLMTDEPGNAADRLRREGVPLELMRLRRIRARHPLSTVLYVLTLPMQVERLRRHIRKTGASIVQAHGVTNFDVAIAARRERVALVWQILDTRAPSLLRKALTPLVVRDADSVLVTGTTIRLFYPALDPIGDRVHSYLPPVEERSSEEISATRARIRTALGATESDVLVGSLANLNPQKGHDHLLRAWGRISDRVAPSVRLLIRGAPSPGHDEYRRLLDDLVSQQGLPPDTVGPLPRGVSSSEFLAALDVFVLSAVGRSEGTPTVIIEAMQAGVPVVVTSAGGVVDLVQDGVEGSIVEVEDDAALAEAIERVVADGDLRQRLGDAARRRALTDFAIDRCEQAYLDAYSDALVHRAG